MRADIKAHSSTVSIDVNNRPREQLDCIAVEGLDKKGVRDKHKRCPKAKAHAAKTKPDNLECFFIGEVNPDGFVQDDFIQS